MTTFPYHKRVVFQKAILVNPITDLFDSTWGSRVPCKSEHPLFREKGHAEVTKMLSPVLNITSDTPKTLLIHGMTDSLVAPSQSYKYHDEMVVYGRDVQLHLIEATNHAFLLAEYMKECDRSLKAAELGVSIIDKWLQEE